MLDFQIHPDFRLNGHHETNTLAWKVYAESLAKSNLDFEQAIADFMLTFLDETSVVELTTSGSTGTPKPIQLKKKHMLASAQATADFFDIKAGTHALLCMPARFVAGKMMLVRAMLMGWHLDAIEPSKNALESDKTYDFVAMTPYQVYHSFSDLEKAKLILVGGGALDTEMEEKIQNLSTRFYASYGMTETSSHVALRPINGKDKSEVYKAISNVSFSTDERSCLVIHAPKVCDEILTTNDVVDLLSSTSFIWKGRFDSVINSGGVKIHPEEVEKKLSKVLSENFFISYLPDAELGNKVILIVESDKVIQNEKLQKAFTTLEKYEVPKQVFYTSKFEWTDTGKIQREQTRQKFL